MSVVCRGVLPRTGLAPETPRGRCYFIPEGAGKAQIVFSDILGSAIKTVDVETGYGVMTVFGQSLSKGQYTYSLLVDGKVIETRKMTKTK